jgi:hypothetical protein
MSRTDNTTPHWVRAIWWEPEHWRCQHAMFPDGRACDLPAEPIVAKEFSTRWRAFATTGGGCAWIPTWDEMAGGGGWSAPPWFNRIEFTCPERRRVRDQLIRARQEYRATGETDLVVETAQHRHRGDWAWW